MKEELNNRDLPTRASIEACFEHRRLIGYGAGLAMLGTQNDWRLPLSYLVDDRPGLAGETLDGLEIRTTDALAAESPDEIFVIIYAFRPDSIRRVSNQLQHLGLQFGVHFIDCSVLNFVTMRPRLQQLGLPGSHENFSIARRQTLYSIPRNISSIAGAWLWIELAESLREQQGSAIECGAYEGGSAFVSLMSSPSLRDRPYHLVDTFAGLPELSTADPAGRAGEFADINLTTIRDCFAEFPHVELHQGLFEAHLPTLVQSPVALAYCDCDLYEGGMTCCEEIWPALVSGGAFLFHDYWVPETPLPTAVPAPFTGIKRAVSEFFKGQDVPVYVFPETTHALVLKP